MDIENKKILILSPHTDDGEFGCGGSIAKLIENNDIYYAAFSCAEESVPDGLPKNTLEIEVKKATLELGISPDRLSIFKYPVRKLNYHRQDILEIMIKLKNRIHPDLVFIPSLDDIHQDHHTIAEEAVRAFKFSSILGYELPWNNLIFKNGCFIKLEQKHINKKVKAIARYESQKFRTYASEEWLRALAFTRGTQIQTKYAEAFEVIRIII
jgi:LmbE family N-acetylglucosaminyl deacetylase